MSLFFDKETFKKETLAQVLSSEFSEISMNTFSYRTPATAAFRDHFFLTNFWKLN